jgi:hypothetical protein
MLGLLKVFKADPVAKLGRLDTIGSLTQNMRGQLDAIGSNHDMLGHSEDVCNTFLGECFANSMPSQVTPKSNAQPVQGYQLHLFLEMLGHQLYLAAGQPHSISNEHFWSILCHWHGIIREGLGQLEAIASTASELGWAIGPSAVSGSRPARSNRQHHFKAPVG